MIKIDDKEIRNPIEQIKKNMDDIEKLKDQIYEVYNYNGVIGSTEIPYVNRSSTNVPEDVNKGWLVDYTGKLFKITGGNTTTLLLDYYASIKGPTGNTGPQGEQGIQGDPGVGIVSIIKTSTSGLVDTYTITYTNGQQSTFTVTNGEKGDPGEPGPTYNAGDNIQINNSTKIISANENIIPKTNYGYDLGSSTKLYKNVYAGGLKNTYFNILTGGVNGHGTAILSTTNAQGTTEGSLRLDYNKIQVNQKLVPSSNNTLDLGASYSKFDKIYVNTLSDGTNTIDVADIGTGSEYTAGDGIDITNDVISVDTDTVALKSDIPDVSDFVTTTALSTTLDDYELKADAFSGDYTDLTNKPTIPTVEANSASTPTDTLTNININGTVYSIQGGGSGNSSSGIYLSSADLDTTVNYNKIILISTITLGNNTLAVDDIIIGANKYVGVVTTIGVNPNNQPVAAVKTLGNITDPDLSNYVTTTSLSTTLADYELKSEAFSGDYDDLTDKPDLSIYAESANLATVATSGSYNDLSNKPTIPNVYNPTITIQKNGTTVDTFRLNQSTAKTINITVPTATSDLTNDSGYITNSALTPYVNEVVVNGDTYTPVNNVVDLGYVTPQGSTLTSGKVYRHRICINSSNTLSYGYVVGEYLSGDSTAYFNGTTVTGQGLTDYFSGVQSALDNRNTTYLLGQEFHYNNKTYNDITNRLFTDCSQIIYSGSFWGSYMYFPKQPTLSTTTGTISSQTVVKSASLSTNYSLEFATDTTYYLFDNVEEYVEFGLVEPANTVKSIEVNGTTYTPTNNVVTLPNYPTLPTLATVATTGDYDDLINKPTIPNINESITPIINDYYALGSSSNKYNKVHSSNVITQHLQSNASSTYSINLPDTTQYTADKTIATTDQLFSGDYDDLTNKPTIPVVPTNVSSFTNDAGYITSAALTPYVTSTDLTTTLADYELAADAFSGDYDDLTDKPDLSIYAESANLATVATSGDYTDLINIPTIPKGLIELYLSASTDGQTGTLTQEQAEALLLNPYNYYIVDNLLNSKYYQLVSYLQQTVMTNTLHTLTFVNQKTNNYYTISIQITAGQSEYVRRQWTFNTGTPYITGISSSDVTTALGYTPGTSNFSGDYDDLTNKPTIPTTATSTVTPTGETLTFTYTDNTTATYTFLTAVSVSTTIS